MKKIKLLLFMATCCMLSVTMQAQSTLKQGLIAHYPMNNTANDTSGNGRNLTATNLVADTNRFGQAKGCYKFNGSSSYIYGTADTGYSVSEFSVSVWFKSKGSQSGNARLFCVGPDNKINGNYSSWFENNNSKHGFLSADPANNSLKAYDFSSSNYKTNSWTHLVITFSNTNAEMKFYVNGSLDVTRSSAGYMTTFTSARNITLGMTGYPNIKQSYFNGWLDDVRFYRRVITSSEVTDLYNEDPYVDLGPDKQMCKYDSLTLDAGGYAKFKWSTGDTTQKIMVKSSGTYWVEVEDVVGTVSADTMVISYKAVPVVALGNDTAFCRNNSFSLNAGTHLKYIWNTNDTTSQIKPSQSGTYWVRVQDSSGCAEFDTIQLTIHQLPQPYIGRDTTVCVGNSVNFNAGFYAKYSWNSGDTTASINPTTAATYMVVVTDTNGCQNADTATLNNFAVPQVKLGNDTALCVNLSLTLNAGNFKRYIWNTGDTVSQINPKQSNTYWVIVQDSNTCYGNDSIDVVFHALPSPQLGPDTSTCTGTSYTFSPGTYNVYAWSNGSSATSISVMAPGYYSVVVTDSNGCKNSDTVYLSNLSIPQISLGNDTAICQNKTITLDAGSHNEYLWNNSSTSATITVSQAGTYSVRVKDTNACYSYDSIQVNMNALPTPKLGNDTTVCPQTSINLTPGSFSIYNWSTGSSSASINVNIPGSYSVMVTDSNGCISSDSMMLNNYTLPVVNLGKDTAACNNSSLQVTPGSNYSSYFWSTGSTSSSIIPVASGAYWVRVSDGTGCFNYDTLNVLLHALPIISLGSDKTVCPGLNSGFNPIGNFTQYLWSDGTTNSYLVTNKPGNYWLMVTDTLGCTNTDTASIFNYPPVFVNLGSDITMCKGSKAKLDAGSGYTYYLWSNGSSNSSITVDTTGMFVVAVTSKDGCVARDTVMVNLYPIINAGFSYTEPTKGTFAFTPNNLTYTSYFWNFGDTSTSAAKKPTHSYQTAGTYTVTLLITDTYGCKDSNTASIATNLSVSSVKQDEMSVYPVPASDILNISASEAAKYIRLFSIDGKMVFELRGNLGKQFSIPVAALNSGTYLIEVMGENDSWMRARFVK